VVPERRRRRLQGRGKPVRGRTTWSRSPPARRPSGAVGGMRADAVQSRDVVNVVGRAPSSRTPFPAAPGQATRLETRLVVVPGSGTLPSPSPHGWTSTSSAHPTTSSSRRACPSRTRAPERGVATCSSRTASSTSGRWRPGLGLSPPRGAEGPVPALLRHEREDLHRRGAPPARALRGRRPLSLTPADAGQLPGAREGEAKQRQGQRYEEGLACDLVNVVHQIPTVNTFPQEHRSRKNEKDRPRPLRGVSASERR